MKLRIWLLLLVIAGALTAGAWWFSPWWVLNQVRAAAERNDAEAISSVIDYPRLRESLKTEVNAALTGRIREGAAGLGEMGRAGATLGAVLAAAVVDKLVETMVRPEFVVRAIRDGQIIIPGERQRIAAPRPAALPALRRPGRQPRHRLLAEPQRAARSRQAPQRGPHRLHKRKRARRRAFGGAPSASPKTG